MFPLSGTPGPPLSTVCFSVVTCAVCTPGRRAPRGPLLVSRGSREFAVTHSRRCSVGLLAPVEGEHPTLLILGVLLALRYLVPLLQQQVKDTSLRGSFGVTRKEMEVSPSTEQLVQVGTPGRHSRACADRSSIQKLSPFGRGAAERRTEGYRCALRSGPAAQTPGRGSRSLSSVWGDSAVKQRCPHRVSKAPT